MAEPEVSIIIPVHDGGETLFQCLEAATSQKSSALEIIVVDNASTDESADIARKFKCKVISLERNRGAAGGRNAGAAEAHGEILLFVDADIVLPDTAVAKVRSWFNAHPDYSALVGVLSERCPLHNLTSQYFNLRKRFDYLQLRQPISVLYGGIHAIWREAFEDAGGFDESFPEVEDAELGSRLAEAGRKIGLDHDLEAIHLHRTNIWNLIRSDARRSALHVRMLMRKGRGVKALAERKVASFRRGAMASAALVPATLALGAGSIIWWPLLIPASLGAAATLAVNWSFLAYSQKVRGGWTAPAFLGILVVDMLAAASGVLFGLLSGILYKRDHEP